MSILDLPKTEKAAVAFLQERGILQKKRICKLHHNMKLYIGDRVYWRCTISSCRTKVSMRVGNWFEGSRLSFVTAIRFIYGWAHEQTSLNWCDNVLNMDKGTAVAWNSYMREVATKALEKSSQNCNINITQSTVTNNIKVEPKETDHLNSSVDVNIGGNSVLMDNPLPTEIKVEPVEVVPVNSTAPNNCKKNSALTQIPLTKEIKCESEVIMHENSTMDSNLSDNSAIENPLLKKIKVESEEAFKEEASHNVTNVIISPAQNAYNRKIGGKEKTVEVYESQFSNYKNKAGRVFTAQWIIGGLCRETKECFLVRVLEPNAHILLTTIENNVKEGSTVCTDKWCGHDVKKLEDAGLEELKCKYNFVHSSSDVLTSNVQSVWGTAKCRSKKQRGIARKYMDSYLAEFMWRTQLDGKDPFDAILDSISQHWPPEIYSHQWHSHTKT